MVGTDRANYCSTTCARRVARSRRRARKRDGYRADVNRADIYKRDGWRCQLCNHVIPQRYRDPNIGKRYPTGNMPRLAPVLDHVIPLAEGGTHEPANVQTAHNHCNRTKGASVYGHGEQLRVV